MMQIFLHFFDTYSLKARVTPALISFAAILVAPVLFMDDLSFKTISVQLAVVVGIPILVILSGVMQAVGNKYQDKLIKIWNGLPSTQYLRIEDETIDKKTKKQIYNKIKENLSIVVSGKDDRVIETAFARIRAYLRKNAPNKLYQKHNANYGLYRNLAGMKWYSFFSTLVVFGAYFAFWKYEFIELQHIDIAVISFVVLLQILSFAVAPYLCKVNAKHYAEEALNTFLLFSEKETNKKDE